MVFLWCTIPLFLSALSIFDLVRRHKSTPRLIAFSTATHATLNLLAFLLWGDCAYLSYWTEEGLFPVCWFASVNYYRYGLGDPMMEIWTLPWFAMVAAIVYVLA